MTSQTSPTGTVNSADEFRAELLDRLGLPADATDADVEATHRAAVALVASAPEAQREWAQEHLAEVEAVRSLLEETVSPEDAAAADAPTGRRRVPWIAWAVAAILLAAGAAFAVHSMTGSTVPAMDAADPTTSASAAPTLDAAQVSALMQKITTNPKDVASLGALADMYFQAGDYKNSAVFTKKVLEITPKAASSWVNLGAAQFNQGDAKGAETSWLKAVALDPKLAEAHYDLGFLYLSSSKPDMAKVKAEWEKVVAIDPTSDIAKNVQTHLKSLESASPAPSSK
jgi:cytochrome c-type biogenesis protein CcmH/NrfG